MNSEGKSWKLWLVAGVLLAAVALAAWFGRPAYRHFKEKRSAAEAQTFFDRGDYRNAWLSARQALQINSNNVVACRVMARLADAAHLPATLDWWQRVAALAPTIDDRLALAAAALRYQSPPFPLTASVLEALSNSAAARPDFHILSAELALATGRPAEAENQFEVASQLEPTNRLFQLNLAVVRLASTNAATADAARARLKQFCADTNLGPVALRSLLADRLLHGDPGAALDYSTQLLASSQATLSDRLQNLDILQRLHRPDFAARLEALQTSATNAVVIAQIAGWMEANGRPADAIAWLNRLPANLQNQTPVQLALADCYLAAGNWLALRDYTAKGSWGDAEFLRLAFLSRAWSQLGEPVVADGDWRSAVSAANNQLGALNALLQLANRWEMKREQEDLLWRILRRFPDASWAQHALEQLYFASGDTEGLYQLYANRFQRAPQNVELKNNLAFTALLLKTNLSQACQWAAEAYAQATNNPAIASTYAYALHVQGRNQDGLAVLQKLGAAALAQPSVALYYGLLLSAVGESHAAAPYLKIARTNPFLLPEEKQLLAGAAPQAD